MTDEELLERADAVANDAYAPYSNYLVGAASSRATDASSRASTSRTPPTRSASARRGRRSSCAVDEGVRPGDLEAIGITASPCGGCRQWLHEFRLDRVTYRRATARSSRTRRPSLLPDTWDLP